MSKVDKFGIVQLPISATGIIGEYDVRQQDIVRFVISGADSGNEITVSARIDGQTDWDALTTLTGNAKSKVMVDAYDFIRLECTTLDATTGVMLSASGFNGASGTTLAIDVPAGDNLTGVSTLTLTSDDNSVVITGDAGTNTIDLSVSVTAGNAFGTIDVPNGTNPVALTAGDTLTYTSSDGSITITGDDATNTIDLIVNAQYEYHVEKVTLDGTDITNGFITLNDAPLTDTLTRLIVIGGAEQEYSVDFTVTGIQLSWSGLDLDGVLIAGDRLIVVYN